MGRPTRRAVVLASAAVAVAARRAFGQAENGAVAGDAALPSGIGYSAKPDGTGPFPVVLVIPDGAADAWAAELCRRLAREGYLAVAAQPYAGGDAADAEVMRALDGAANWAGRNGGDLSRRA